jgi:hypothetical protein
MLKYNNGVKSEEFWNRFFSCDKNVKMNMLVLKHKDPRA